MMYRVKIKTNTVRKTISLISIFLIWQISIRLIRRIYPFPAPAFIGRFLDSDLRRKMQPPQLMLDRSGIQAGQMVLELGCGSGAYTTFASKRVGPQGKVYALDIQEGMLQQLKGKLDQSNDQSASVIVPVQGSATKLPFEDGTLDIVYLVTVLMEIPNRENALSEIYRVLKPGGSLAITEFLPDPDYPSRKTVLKLGKQAGFVPEEISGTIFNYTIRFRKIKEFLI